MVFSPRSFTPYAPPMDFGDYIAFWLGVTAFVTIGAVVVAAVLARESAGESWRDSLGGILAAAAITLFMGLFVGGAAYLDR